MLGECLGVPTHLQSSGCVVLPVGTSWLTLQTSCFTDTSTPGHFSPHTSRLTPHTVQLSFHISHLTPHFSLHTSRFSALAKPMRRQTYQPCELTACAKNAGVPVCALCRWVDDLETVPAYAQEVPQKPSEESCERLWQLNFVLDACQVVVALGGGGHFS